jgi:hypothetical protein
MTFKIDVPAEIEAALHRKAAASGQDLSEYLQRMMAAEAEDELPVPPSGESTEAYMSRLREMIRRHAVRCGHVDDSRESIYAGRGE